MTRSVVMLTAVNPYPTDSGKAIVLAGFLRHLRQRLDPKDIHFLHVGKPIEDLSPFEGVDVVEMGMPKRAEQITSLVKGVAMRGHSLQEAFTASPTIAARIHETMQLIGADLELIDTIRMAQLVDFPPIGRRIVYLDDLFSVRYRRMLEVIESGAIGANFDPLGQFGQFIPNSLHGLTQADTTRKMLLRLESARVAQSEQRVARDHRNSELFLLNDAEADTLMRRSGRPVTVLPVSIERSATPPREWSGKPEFIFMGLLSIAHNHDGLANFLRLGMPRLLELQPGAVLHIVGRDAADELYQLAEPFSEHVVFHGFVSDLDQVFSTKCALVNPLRFGSGVKIKTLDALARGVPVVATQFGAEGIASRTQPGLEIVKDAVEAAEAMARLVEPQAHAEAVTGAQRLFADRFSAPAVAAAYDAAFGTRP